MTNEEQSDNLSQHTVTTTLASSPCANQSTVRRRFSIFLSYFVGSPKIETSLCKLRSTISRSCGAPYGVFGGQCSCPCGCSNRSLRSLAGLFQHIFGLFCMALKNRHITLQTSIDRFSFMWCPLRGVRRPVWLSLRVSNGEPPHGVNCERSEHFKQLFPPLVVFTSHHVVWPLRGVQRVLGGPCGFSNGSSLRSSPGFARWHTSNPQ